MLAALGLAPGAAHTLELLPKMQYSGELYATVTSTLYQMYGIAGAVVQVGALFATAVLVFAVRRRPSFHLTLLGGVGLSLSLILWAVLVAPVNAEWARVIESTPASIADVYLQLRMRWEYGHVAAFSSWLLGYSFLIGSVLVDESKTAASAVP